MDKIFKYFKADPSGNITGFVLESIALEDRKKYADYIMTNIDKDVEQVGFISFSKNGKPFRMDMMGGEFCANATRAYALFCALKSKKNFKKDIMVSVSGTDYPINAKVNLENSEVFIEMPKAKNLFRTKILGRDFFTVDLDGIVHMIVESQEDSEFAKVALKELVRKINSKAYGIMFIDKYTLTMIPYVYVVKTNTLFRESSCGSGTIACAYYLNQDNNKHFNVILKQPKGILEIKSRYINGNIIYSIGGKIKLYDEKLVSKTF